MPVLKKKRKWCKYMGYQNDEIIRIEYENEDGVVFVDEIDSVDELEETISMLKSEGFIKFTVEYNDKTFWLDHSKYTVSEIEDFIRKDMQAEMEDKDI